MEFTVSDMKSFFVLIILLSFHSAGKALSAEIVVSDQSAVNTVSRALHIANEGDTIRVEKGIYNERIRINKSVKLLGIDYPEITGNGEGTVINVNAPGVVIKGFRITSTGTNLSREDCAIETTDSPGVLIEDNILSDVLFGIYIKNSPGSVIRNNVINGKHLALANRGDGIRLWYSSETKVLNNRLNNTRDMVIWWSSETLIRGNEVKNGRYGLHYMYSNHNRFEQNLFIGNAVGGFLMYSKDIQFHENIFAKNQGLASGYGVGFKDLDDIVAENNIFIDNRVGIYADNSPHSVNSWNNIRKNVIAFNDIGVSLMPSIERNLFVGNSFIENYEQVEIRGGGTLEGNRWYEDGRGNYWSNYAGYDSNADGVGDIPFVYESLFENFIDRNPELRLFIYSPASQAIELASEAVPVIKPEPKLVDKFPLTSPYLAEIAGMEEKKSSLPFLTVSFIILLIPLLSYVFINRKGGHRN